MHLLPKTKYFVALCLLIVGGLAIFAIMGFGRTYAEPASVLVSVPSTSDEKVGVEVVSSGISDDERKTFRDRLIAFVGVGALATTGSVEEATPIEENDLPDESSSDEEINFASSVDFCDNREDRIASTFSPQGSTTVSLGEGARVIMLSTEEGGEDTVQVLQVPETPLYREKSDCIREAIVGIGLDGRYIYAGIPYTTEREGLVGYARDGFGIFAPAENGGNVTSAELDVCHGHVHEVVWDGVVTSLYHYHITDDAPFTIGCYRGLPVE